MAISLLIHVTGEDAFVLDVEELPMPQDQILVGTNPRYRDGKEVRNILPEVNTVILPWWRVNFIEVLPSKEEEEVYGFYRD
jgi:hypothetical protein